MEQTNLEELVLKRQKWVQSSKENNFDFDSILAGTYNDLSHFIYEILQNAEDESATEISFNLYSNRLEIEHNGEDFDFDDVDGITGIGISTKKEDINAIGKFGVGFKSVFAITKTPIIHSGLFHFRIEDFVVPSLINSNEIKETLIVLPFNHPSRTNEEVFEIVRKKLESIGLKTMLFLNNIKEIKWKTPEKNGHYYKEFSNFQDVDNVHRISVISQIEQEENLEEFIVIKKPIIIESYNLNVEIAYRIKADEAGKDVIEKEKDSRLIVFFPTEKVTYLNFLIQGPYKTTPNRENIPLDDEQNRFIIEETAKLVAESIPIIKKLGLLNISFLEVLPINRDRYGEKIYSAIYDKVKEKFLSNEAILPTYKSKYSTASNALLARGKELTEFLHERDIKILFDKRHWLDTSITYEKTRELHNYLIKELEIKQVDFENFAENITKQFIEKKPDKWLNDFYGRLLEPKRWQLWKEKKYIYSLGTYHSSDILKRKPIIRLQDNTHIEPYDENNKIQVYLPSKTKSEYKTVKDKIVKNRKSLNFLKELGLTEPDILAEIKEFIIPKYRDQEPEVNLDEYSDDLEKLLRAFREIPVNKREEFTSDLKDLFIIHSSDSFSVKKQFKIPQDVYIRSEDLLEYFKGFNYVCFISDELYRNFNDNSDLDEYLRAIGCQSKPKQIKVDSELTDEEKKVLREKTSGKMTYEISTIDYDYEGLDNFITELTIERSVLLWKFLVESIEQFENKWNKKSLFEGKYKWFFRAEKDKEFEAKFARTLKTTAWLVDRENKFVLPNQISLSDLPDCYIKNNENVKVLEEVFGFQDDEIRKVEKKTGGKFIPKEEIELYEKWKEERLQNDEFEWSPETNPDGVETTIEETNLEPIQISVVPNNEKQERTRTIIDKPYTDIESERSTRNVKEIGKWGEKLVFNELKKEFGMNVEWLNQNGECGKGCDLIIKSNGIETMYIEVKSKTDELPHSFEITGTQWGFARKLYEKNEGDKYRIYVVSNAGTKNAKIKVITNPVKLWKENRLIANPIKIEL